IAGAFAETDKSADGVIIAGPNRLHIAVASLDALIAGFAFAGSLEYSPNQLRVVGIGRIDVNRIVERFAHRNGEVDHVRLGAFSAFPLSLIMARAAGFASCRDGIERKEN